MLYVFVFILNSYPENLRSSASQQIPWQFFWRLELRRVQGYHAPCVVHGGEGGIRTHVRAFGPQVDFESTPLRPLRYLSGNTALATEITENTEKIRML